MADVHEWHLIDSDTPRNESVMLGWWEYSRAYNRRVWRQAYGYAGGVNTMPPESGVSNGWLHGSATHWCRPVLPVPPIDEDLSGG